jgi:hypothetical protein
MTARLKLRLACLLVFAAIGHSGGASAPGADKPAKASGLPSAKQLAEEHREFIDDADATVDVNVSALFIPTRLLAKYPRDSERQKFQQEFRALFLEGFQKQSSALDAAKTHFRTARRIAPDDPRACYAHGIVLLFHRREIAALEEFQAAANANTLPYLPAWQGIAWTLISRKNYGQGLPAVLDLAMRLEATDAPWPDAEDREHAAEWLGRLVEFLEGPGKTTEQAAAIEKLAADVAARMKGDVEAAYYRGREQVATRYSELRAVLSTPAAEMPAVAKRESQAIMAAAAAAETTVKKLQEELSRVKRPHDRQLADWNSEIHARIDLIEVTTAKLPAAETVLESYANPKKHAQMKGQGGRRPGKVVAREENEGEKKIRETELNSAQKALDRLNGTIDKARQEIARFREQRDAKQHEYRQATAEIRKALRAEQIKAAELSPLAREAERGTLTVETLAARVKALDTYVLFVPELEQARLLATLTSH